MTIANSSPDVTVFPAPRGAGRKARYFWSALAVALVLDVSTKLYASHALQPHEPREVLGEVLRLTLSHNPGGAMGIYLRGASRVVFSLLAGIVIYILVWFYRESRPEQRLRGLALGLIVGGALGNLIDRLRSSRGVIDFLDVGLGAHRFWTFNVADVAVTVGSILLAFTLAGEQRALQERRKHDRAAWAKMKSP